MPQAARLAQAEALLVAGAVAEAEAAYAGLLETAPGNLHVRIGLGRCARRRGDRVASLAQFAAAAAIDTDSGALRVEVAADLLELGRLEEAEAAFTALLKSASGTLHVRIGLGRCARQRGDRVASLAHFSAGAVIDPDNVALRIEVAADLRELGRLQEAEAAFAALLQTAPGNLHVRVGLGRCARQRGDRVASMAHFTAAAAIDPTNITLRIEVAADLRELGRLREAEAKFLALLAEAPDNLTVLLGLGHCARRRGDHAAALARFRRAAQLWPDSAAAWLEIAAEQREAGDLEAALQTARQVLARVPDDLGAWLNIGATLRAAERHREALEAYREAHKAQPARAAPLVEMAVEERTLGRQEECDRLLAAARALEPKDLAVLQRLGEQALIADAPAAALRFFEDAVVEQPGQLVLQLGLTQALVHLGRMDEALARLDQLARDFGLVPLILGRRLGLLRQAGFYHEALGLAREVTAESDAFQYWADRMPIELLVGADDGLDDCLARLSGDSVHQRATRRRFAGSVAESRWQLREARAHYQAAVALKPQDGGMQYDLVRTNLLLLDHEEARRHLQRQAALTAHVTRLQGKSLNVSQTHYGQMLDDYCLNAGLLTEIKATLALPPEPRVAALSGLVARNPNSTAAAVTLMVALRQAGAWDRRGCEAPGRGGIPRRIVQFWDEDEPPEDIACIMQSWRRLNPDYRFEHFNEAAAQRYLGENFAWPVLQAFNRALEPAQKADIFRLATLAAEGGIYADADDRCLMPVATFVPQDAALVMYQEDHGTVGNNFLAAAPRHPVMLRALQGAVTAINRGDTDIVWLSTGPGLLTRAFARVLAAGGGPGQGGADVVVLHRRSLFRAVGVHCSAGYKRTDRHWSHSSFPGRGTAPAAPAGAVPVRRTG